ncbi:MAG TPA: translocation/assembly module TamB domain-containing protein [Rhodothermales bacterium]|nr:translocation/assembly module TamB domain-containing protein [Rhodothermales bacterium]
MPKRLLHIPKGLFKLAVFLVVLGAAALFALIRTQAGRDFLGQQIEAEFGKAFHGSLQIGRLYGNLARTFYATDVSIYDPEGRTVVHIDSLVFRLGLLDGLRQNVTIRHAEFLRPRFWLIRDDSLGWNIQRALALRERSGPSKAKWAFRSADVGVSDASITTRNAGNRPAIVDSLLVFDFTNAHFEGIEADATIEWAGTSRLIDLRHLEAFLTDQNLEISSLRSQVAITDSSITVNEAELTMPASRVQTSFRIAGLDSLQVLGTSTMHVPQVVVNISDAHFDSTEMASLFPRLNLPNMQLHLLAGGSSDDFLVDDVFLQVGEAKVSGRGRIAGWPDSLSFTADVEEALIDPKQIAEFLPAASAVLAGIPEHQLRGAISGVVHTGVSGRFELFRAKAGFQSDSDIGIAGGEINVQKGLDGTLRYDGQLLFSEYKAAAWLPELGETLLNGDLAFGGSGTSVAALDGSAHLGIRSSVIRGVSFDSLDLRVNSDSSLLSLNFDGWGRDGIVSLRAGLNLRHASPDLDAVLTLQGFNAIAFSSGTAQPGAGSVSAVLDLNATGSTTDDLIATATVVVDTATFFVGTDTLTLSPSRHSLSVDHPDSLSTRLEVAGDVLEGRLDGRFTFAPLIRTVGLWVGAAAHTISEQQRKRLHPEGLLVTEDVGEEAFELEKRALRDYLLVRGFGSGLGIDWRIGVKRMRDLHQLSRSVPPEARFADFIGSGRLSADSLSLSLNVIADSVRGNSLSIDDLSLRTTIAGLFDYSLDETLSASVDLDMGRLEAGAQRLEGMALDYAFADQRGDLSLRSIEPAEGGLSVSLDASLSVLPEWNEVQLLDLTVRNGGYVWRTRDVSRLQLFGDALGIEDLEIRSLHGVGEFDRPEQVLAIDGVLSDGKTDTLRFDARFVRLEEISEIGRFGAAIGGEMHAAVTVAHALGEPRAAGDLSVSALAFDGRDLGDLRVRSVYSSPTEGIAVDVKLTQPREKATGVQRFDAHIHGTVRPPGTDSGDYGSLNLAVELAEFDVFFFEYLFPNELAEVSGEGSGSGTITGDFDFPQFDASFQIDRSSFLVPEFNLRFGLSGPVTVDRSGFHLDEVALTDPTGGQGALRGDILFNDYRFFSFDIAADLSELMIMNVSRSMDLSFYGQVWVSGSATLTGPLQQTLLRSTDAVTAQKSRLYLPVTEDEIESDKTFIVFADSAGEFRIQERRSILSKRPQTERAFVEGMDMSFNIFIPEESSVYLVFDPLLGDVIHALGSGRVQLQRREGDFQAFGTFTVESGDYLFTAGEVFQRRFILQSGGTITWDGDPIDARLNIPAVYRTRASLAGLPGQNPEERIPIRVDMSLTGRVTIPIVDLRIALDQEDRGSQVIPPGLESALNQPDLAVEYATSVLLTNTFLLTSNQGSDALTNTADDLLFHSLSQLVSSQLNRFVSQALNLDVNVGVQQGRTEEEYDLIYGFALRLDDQRVIIRGEGLYETGANEAATAGNGIQGAFVVEYRLTPSVQLEFFFRRESDLYRAASSLGTAYGVGIVYQTSFPNWGRFGRKLQGRKEPKPEQMEKPASAPASD